LGLLFFIAPALLVVGELFRGGAAFCVCHNSALPVMFSTEYHKPSYISTDISNLPQFEAGFGKTHAGKGRPWAAWRQCSPLPTYKSGGRPRSRSGQSTDWPARGRRRKPTPGLDGGRTADYPLWAGGTFHFGTILSCCQRWNLPQIGVSFRMGGVLGAVPLTSGILLSKFRTCCDSGIGGAAVCPFGPYCETKRHCVYIPILYAH